MKYGVWSYYYRLPAEEMVVAFAQKGWLTPELSSEHGEELFGRGDPAEVGARFKAFADSHGVTFPQGHLWLGADIAGKKWESVVETLKGWLDLFYAIGIKACVLHAGGGWMRKNGASEDEIDAANVRAIKLLCEHIKGRDIYICLENLIQSYPFAGDLLRLIHAADSPQLKICLDTGHLNINKGKQSDFIRESGSRLKALHIHENEGEHDQHMMPYGKGTVDWDDTMSALAALDEPYDGLFNFEIPGESGKPDEILDAKLDYLRVVAGYMLRGLK